MNSQAELTELTAEETNRKGFWEILQKSPACDIAADCTAAEPETVLQEQTLKPEEPSCQQTVDPAPDEVRELPEAKLLKQLNEMTHLLEQQTTILYAQQKLLEDLSGHQKQLAKRRPGMAKKLKSLIHKGKIIWSVL